MGLTKTEIFTDKQNKLATMLKALGHPARIAIIQHIIKINSCICGDLVDELGSGATDYFPTSEGIKKCWYYTGNH